MSAYCKLFVITVAFIALQHGMPRTSALKIPEKIIGGVIDIVHSHKNKPSQQQGTYPPNYQPGYPQGYPQYQQWNQNQNYQNGYQTQFQGQYQTQGQYNNNFAQGGSGSNYAQGNYQQPSGGYPSGQYGGSGSQGSYGTGQQGQYYPQGGQYQGQQGSQSSGGGGFHVSSGHQVTGSGQGPTCVCQAWSKPLADTPDEKTPTTTPEKSENPENTIPEEDDKEKPEA